MNEIKEIVVSLDSNGFRLDQALVQLCQGLSRAQIQKMIESKSVRVNGQIEKKRYLVRAGDLITCAPILEERTDSIAESMNFEILYEDEALFVINKPPNLVVHPAPGNRSGTFVNGLLFHCKDLESDDPIRPGIVHRLDKDTSGVLIAAKNTEVLNNMSKQFHDRIVEKEYVAIVKGVLPKEREIAAPIGRDPRDRKKMAIVENGKSARTKIAPLTSSENYSFIRAQLYTGRTHQLRVHLSSIGLPILGDGVYGVAMQGMRQMLHCASIGCFHPITKEWIRFSANLLPDMDDLLKRLRLG